MMRSPEGMEHPMSGRFHEVVAPERLVFTAIPESARGEALAECVTVVTFEALGDRTRVTVEASGVGLAAIAREMLGGMEAGWAESLVRLGEVLAGEG